MTSMELVVGISGLMKGIQDFVGKVIALALLIQQDYDCNQLSRLCRSLLIIVS